MNVSLPTSLQLHTRKVAGSIPAGTTGHQCRSGLFRCPDFRSIAHNLAADKRRIVPGARLAAEPVERIRRSANISRPNAVRIPECRGSGWLGRRRRPWCKPCAGKPHARIERGMGKRVRPAETAPLTTNGESGDNKGSSPRGAGGRDGGPGGAGAPDPGQRGGFCSVLFGAGTRRSCTNVTDRHPNACPAC
jgi:hypothetical protein